MQIKYVKKIMQRLEKHITNNENLINICHTFNHFFLFLKLNGILLTISFFFLLSVQDFEKIYLF